MDRSRREFLAEVGKGMLVASVGSGMACDLGLANALADDKPPTTITFDRLEPLASLMEDTPAAKLLPLLVEKIRGGTDLRTLVAAGALANTRKFGGQNYDGWHHLMALAPAFEMAKELPEAERPVPVLKVLYRNTDNMQRLGGRSKETLHPVEPAEIPEGKGIEMLQAATVKRDMLGAERIFATLAGGSAEDAFNNLQHILHDNGDVHRVVLAWRSWALLDLTGKEHAHTMLRQSVRFCVEAEGTGYYDYKMRTLLPKLLDQHRLLSKPLGTRQPEDAWIEKLSQTIYAYSGDQAAETVAAALAEGFAPEAIGEALSLTANQFVLRDPGRPKGDSIRPAGSVHGNSVGVHASDACNAWRNIARVSNPRNAIASMIVGAYYTAGEKVKGQHPQPYPFADHLEKVQSKDPAELLRQTEAAILAKDQIRATALVHRYGELGQSPRPVFDLLLRYAVSEDGALHAEKYYRTVTEEFATTRPAFRWRHLDALARVTTSEYGFPAPGYAEARQLLKL